MGEAFASPVVFQSTRPRVRLASHNYSVVFHMAQITELGKITVPLGGQQIELQQIDHAEDGMSLLRVRIREGRRFTIFDIDAASAERWAELMQQWAKAQR